MFVQIRTFASCSSVYNFLSIYVNNLGLVRTKDDNFNNKNRVLKIPKVHTTTMTITEKRNYIASLSKWSFPADQSESILL